MSVARHEIDLDAFAANLRAIRERVAPAALMLVVKDDAYRHGPGVIARALEEGVTWFGAFDVATAETALPARPEGVGVFVWTIGDSSDAERAVAGRMDVGIGEAAQLDLVAAAAAAAGTRARVHLKIDTGLHRNGFRPDEWEAAVSAAREWEERGVIDVVGVWSHIAEASDDEDDEARRVFDDAVTEARAAGLRPSLRHLAASAASFARPEFRYDLVRVGAFAYGIRPAGGPGEDELGITPILTLRATVREAGERDVVIDIGSLDGVPGILAGRMSVDTPAGVRAVRAIHETTSVVDGWEGAAVGDAVTIYGPASKAGRSATDLAELIDTIGEEIVLRTGKGDGARPGGRTPSTEV